MNASICGIGTWLPATIRGNHAWPPSFAAGDHLAGDRTFNDIPPASDPVAAAILERHLAAEANDPFLGATRRHIADPAFTAAEAECRAAVAALANAGIDAADVDILFSNSAVPDRILPTTAVIVAHRIGAKRALAQASEAACASAVTQIETARAYIESGLARVVLLTHSHLMLRTFPLAHPASPGLGDAATAMVIARGKGLKIRSTFGMSHGEYADAVTWIRGSDAAADPPWFRSGGDFRVSSRDPAAVKLLMRDTVSYGAQTIREVATRADVDVSRIQVIASVQPRGFIPGAIAERLGLDHSCAVTTYDSIAHVGVCGPAFNLVEAQRRGKLQPGALVAVYGQGAGFTRAAAVLEVE